MMQSNNSENSHRRQYSDRSLRQWDDYVHRWDERRASHRDISQGSYQKYGGNGHGSAERTGRSREYSDSPHRLYSKDSLNRDSSRERSARRPASTPDWGTFEKKRRRFTEDDNDEYRYRREPEDKTSRLSPDRFSSSPFNKDSKHTQEEDFQYRKTPKDSRHRHEFTNRQHHDGCRQSYGYYNDRDGRERSRDCSQERMGSRDRSTKSYAKPRERNDSPSSDHEDYRQNRTRFLLNASRGRSFQRDAPNQSNAVPEQKSALGFQRFLAVLNKGVNVAALTKMVTHSVSEVGDRPSSPNPFMNTDRPWSPSYPDGQGGSRQDTSHWCESKGSQRSPSPRHRRRSFSPRRRSLSDEKSQRMGERERRYFSSNSRSQSPAVVEKITLTPEDKQKQRQMQDVLQAIGINLGSEELGQMSHRIQERLYGKRDSGRYLTGSRERETRRAYSPRPRTRSLSRSSFSPLNQEYYNKKDLYSAQRDVTKGPKVQVYEAVDYGQSSSCSTLQEREKCETYSQESTAAGQAISQNTAYTLSKPPPPPVMPMYPPVNCSPMPYPPPPPHLPPNLPHLGPRLFLPCRPPFFPYPRVPPGNVFPAGLAQTRHLFPPHISRPPFNLPVINPMALNTTHKSKPLSRPRCLQVIETKQPG